MLHFLFVAVFIGGPAILGAFIYPTPGRLRREARRRRKFEEKMDMEE